MIRIYKDPPFLTVSELQGATEAAVLSVTVGGKEGSVWSPSTTLQEQVITQSLASNLKVSPTGSPQSIPT